MYCLKLYKINHDFNKRPVKITRTYWKTITVPFERLIPVSKMFREVFSCQVELIDNKIL